MEDFKFTTKEVDAAYHEVVKPGTLSVSVDTVALEWYIEFETRGWGVKDVNLHVTRIWGVKSVEPDDPDKDEEEEDFEINLDKEKYDVRIMPMEGGGIHPTHVDINTEKKRIEVTFAMGV